MTLSHSGTGPQLSQCWCRAKKQKQKHWASTNTGLNGNSLDLFNRDSVPDLGFCLGTVHLTSFSPSYRISMVHFLGPGTVEGDVLRYSMIHAWAQARLCMQCAKRVLHFSLPCAVNKSSHVQGLAILKINSKTPAKSLRYLCFLWRFTLRSFNCCSCMLVSF